MALNIERIEVLLLIAAIVAMLARRLHLPYTVGLTIAGIGVALSSVSINFELTKDLLFTTFLPPLIFEAALHTEWRSLRADTGVVTTLATLGILIASGLTSAGLHYLAGWPWAGAVLLGLLISATDPVSVIATFKEAGAIGRLRLLVESESLFNDGTVAVLYAVALAASAGGVVSIRGITGAFVITVAGGIFCGALVGGLMLLLAWHTEDYLIEVTFSTVAAYGSFLLAESFHCSGVLATLTAGILIGNTGFLGALTTRGREAVEHFWEFAGFIVNSLIFLMIGIRLGSQNFLSDLNLGLLVIGLVLMGRAAAVYGCCALFQRTARRVSMNHQHVLVWGGLRGALALGLPAGFPEHDAIVSISFSVVAFSIIVQGMTITPLLRNLGELPERKHPEG